MSYPIEISHYKWAYRPSEGRPSAIDTGVQVTDHDIQRLMNQVRLELPSLPDLHVSSTVSGELIHENSVAIKKALESRVEDLTEWGIDRKSELGAVIARMVEAYN